MYFSLKFINTSSINRYYFIRKTVLQKYSDAQPRELGFLSHFYLKSYMYHTIQTTSQTGIYYSLKLCGIWIFRFMTFRYLDRYVGSRSISKTWIFSNIILLLQYFLNSAFYLIYTFPCLFLTG